jgi:type II secretory pathway component PulF
MSLKNISNYSKQLSTTLNSGLSIDRVLETVSRTAPTKRMRTVSREIKQSIDSGSTLTQAVEQYPRTFPDFFRQAIHVGERTGKLEHVAASLSSYYEQRYAIARKVRAELYPILAYAALLIGMVVLIEFITGGKPAVMGLVDLLAWPVLAAMALWSAFYFSQGFRSALGSVLFHIPFVGRFVRKFSLSKFCEGLQLGLEAGVDVRTAITLSADASGNAAFRKRALRALEKIEQGATLSDSLAGTGVFPFDAVQMFIVGEETGKLPQSMAHVANLTREQATESLHLTLILGIRFVYLLVMIGMAIRVVSFYTRLYSGILDPDLLP